MPDKPVVLNNTPLSALWAIGQLGLLQGLYHEVLIPAAVHDEFLATHREERQTALAQATFVRTVQLRQPQQVLAYVGLDRGEAEVLALALEQDARLVIIDERKGRRFAQRLGLTLTGTIGVLLLAKEEGLITAVAPLIEQVRNSGLYVSHSLVSKALALAGEDG